MKLIIYMGLVARALDMQMYLGEGMQIKAGWAGAPPPPARGAQPVRPGGGG